MKDRDFSFLPTDQNFGLMQAFGLDCFSAHSDPARLLSLRMYFLAGEIMTAAMIIGTILSVSGLSMKDKNACSMRGIDGAEIVSVLSASVVHADHRPDRIGLTTFGKISDPAVLISRERA